MCRRNGSTGAEITAGGPRRKGSKRRNRQGTKGTEFEGLGWNRMQTARADDVVETPLPPPRPRMSGLGWAGRGEKANLGVHKPASTRLHRTPRSSIKVHYKLNFTMQKPVLVLDNGAHSIKAHLLGSGQGPRSALASSTTDPHLTYDPSSHKLPCLVTDHLVTLSPGARTSDDCLSARSWTNAPTSVT